MNVYQYILYDDVDSVRKYHHSRNIHPVIPSINGFSTSTQLELASAITLSRLNCVSYYIYEIDTYVNNIHVKLAEHARFIGLQDASIVYDFVLAKAKNDYIKLFINDEFW